MNFLIGDFFYIKKSAIETMTIEKRAGKKGDFYRATISTSSQSFILDDYESKEDAMAALKIFIGEYL